MMAACARRELNRRKESFVLRRTAELNARFLPPLHSYIVFCRPTELQARPKPYDLGSQ
jgi:DNA repair and recombination protein RAD54B